MLRTLKILDPPLWCGLWISNPTKIWLPILKGFKACILDYVLLNPSVEYCWLLYRSMYSYIYLYTKFSIPYETGRKCKNYEKFCFVIKYMKCDGELISKFSDWIIILKNSIPYIGLQIHKFSLKTFKYYIWISQMESKSLNLVLTCKNETH